MAGTLQQWVDSWELGEVSVYVDPAGHPHIRYTVQRQTPADDDLELGFYGHYPRPALGNPLADSFELGRRCAEQLKADASARIRVELDKLIGWLLRKD